METSKTLTRDLYAEGSVTVAGAVHFSGLGRTTLYELMASGQLPYTKIGNRRLIARLAIINLLARHAGDLSMGAR